MKNLISHSAFTKIQCRYEPKKKNFILLARITGTPESVVTVIE